MKTILRTLCVAALVALAPTSARAQHPIAGDWHGSLSTPGTGRTIVRYSWDFGDGESKTGVKTTHDYPVSGVYLATLIVTDDAGQTARSSQPVTVRPAIP